MELNLKLRIKDEDAVVDRGMYQRLVRKLIYLCHSWPHIAYVVK